MQFSVSIKAWGVGIYGRKRILIRALYQDSCDRMQEDMNCRCRLEDLMLLIISAYLWFADFLRVNIFDQLDLIYGCSVESVCIWAWCLCPMWSIGQSARPVAQRVRVRVSSEQLLCRGTLSKPITRNCSAPSMLCHMVMCTSLHFGGSAISDTGLLYCI